MRLPPKGGQSARLLAGRRWLIEGNYAGAVACRLFAAYTVIFLDLPATAYL